MNLNLRPGHKLGYLHTLQAIVSIFSDVHDQKLDEQGRISRLTARAIRLTERRSVILVMRMVASLEDQTVEAP